MMRYVVLLGLLAPLIGCHTPSPMRMNHLVDTHLIQGLKALNKKDWVVAKEHLDFAVKLTPKSSITLDALAYYYELHGEADKAAGMYQKALDAHPQGAALNNYGTFLCRQGGYRKAVSYFIQACRAKDYDDCAKAYHNAALCAAKIPDKRMAAKFQAMAVRPAI